MNSFKEYIVEKLKINKDTILNTLKPGDKIYEICIQEDRKHYRLSFSNRFDIVKSFHDNKISCNLIKDLEVFLNSNNFYEAHYNPGGYDTYSIFITNKDDAIRFIKMVKKYQAKQMNKFDNKEFAKYLDEKDHNFLINYNIRCYYTPEVLDKILDSLENEEIN